MSVTKDAYDFLTEKFGYFNKNHPINVLGYSKGLELDIEDIINCMEEYINQSQEQPKESIEDMTQKQKSELMLTGNYYLKCEQTPCKCTDLESCDNSVVMGKKLPQAIKQEQTQQGQYLKCPECKGALKYFQDMLKCNSCGATYDIPSQSQEQPQQQTKLEKLADEYADDCGYPKSDKEHFETTYWTQHNIAQHSFISGYKAALLSQQKDNNG